MMHAMRFTKTRNIRERNEDSGDVRFGDPQYAKTRDTMLIRKRGNKKLISIFKIKTPFLQRFLKP